MNDQNSTRWEPLSPFEKVLLGILFLVFLLGLVLYFGGHPATGGPR